MLDFSTPDPSSANDFAQLLANWPRSWIPSPDWTSFLLLQILDIGLVLALTYIVLVLIGERRTLWMVRGFIVLMLVTAVSRRLGLSLLSFFLSNLTIGAAVAMAVLLQSEFRRLLERLGRGEIGRLFAATPIAATQPDNTIDAIVEAIKELSQNRTGALIVMETSGPLDDRDFSVPGVKLNAVVSKELLQTIFQTTTLLHDGAVVIQGSQLSAAGTILPISERQASRQLGTRHRAAMGITERVENCLCIVVSEETGSISVAERGQLNRPLTSSRLREILQAKFTPVSDRDAVTPDLLTLVRRINRHLSQSVVALMQRWPLRSARPGRGALPPRSPTSPFSQGTTRRNEARLVPRDPTETGTRVGDAGRSGRDRSEQLPLGREGDRPVPAGNDPTANDPTANDLTTNNLATNNLATSDLATSDLATSDLATSDLATSDPDENLIDATSPPRNAAGRSPQAPPEDTTAQDLQGDQPPESSKVSATPPPTPVSQTNVDGDAPPDSSTPAPAATVLTAQIHDLAGETLEQTGAALASEDVASRDMPSRDITSQNLAAQNLAAQNLAAQNLAAQNLAARNRALAAASPDRVDRDAIAGANGELDDNALRERAREQPRNHSAPESISKQPGEQPGAPGLPDVPGLDHSENSDRPLDQRRGEFGESARDPAAQGDREPANPDQANREPANRDPSLDPELGLNLPVDSTGDLDRTLARSTLRSDLRAEALPEELSEELVEDDWLLDEEAGGDRAANDAAARSRASKRWEEEEGDR